jgi:hypothetical protein
MTTIPNELKIIINTNIPGYQNIEYKPYMTLPNDKVDNSIHFNPLVKLNSSIIKSIPESVQIREFFNKGLFQSLINAHGLVKEKNLSEATNEGYVDNNIQVTLETLFPSNSILYINKQPYVIGDVQWSKGDWKINKKIESMPTLDTSKITDPYLYRTIVQEELISGEKEMKELPSDIVYGPNYTGPLNNVASGVVESKDATVNIEKKEAPEKPSVPIFTPTPPTVPKPSAVINKPYKSTPTPAIAPAPTESVVQEPQKPYKPTPTPAIEYTPSATVEESIKPYKPTPIPAIEDEPINKPFKTRPYPAIESGSDIKEEETSPSVYEIDLNVSGESTSTLQNYFNNSDYYTLVNTIFKNMEEKERSLIQKIVKQTTSVNVKSNKNLNPKAYKETVKNIKVNTNTGKGDCFFIAVADGINYYNLTTNYNSNKIIYNNYGKGNMIYTQKMLRELVSYHTLHLNSIEYDEMKDVLQFNVDSLNELFRKQYEDYKKLFENDPISEKMLMDIINDIYYGNDNFLIKKPTKITNENLINPFKIVNKSEIKSYIESSDYWANSIAIDALCDMLGLNIIVLEVKNDKIRVPYIYNDNKTYSRYMFLYHENNHYELISFEYQIKKQKTIKTIFNKNETLYPPFSIIFLIFATNYIRITDSTNKKNYTLLPNIFAVLENAYNKIIVNDKDKEDIKFNKLFKKYFESSFGGEGGARQPYYQPYVSKYVKQKYNIPSSKKSNISYYITINMYLKKGTTLTKEELNDLKCSHQWNSIRRSYADMRGLNYSMLPDYDNIPTDSDTKTNNNKTQKRRNYLNLNKTRRR